MRKVTERSVNALIAMRSYREGNTEVVVTYTEEGDPKESILLLHGNKIATKRGDSFFITNAGWQTNTTKERLNAIPGVSIQQKNWNWYLNGEEWDGSLIEIKS